MLAGRGNAQHIVCPLHRWTYELNGELLGAPRFSESPCVKLRSRALTRWNGLLFNESRNTSCCARSEAAGAVSASAGTASMPASAATMQRLQYAAARRGRRHRL